MQIKPFYFIFGFLQAMALPLFMAPVYERDPILQQNEIQSAILVELICIFPSALVGAWLITYKNEILYSSEMYINKYTQLVMQRLRESLEKADVRDGGESSKSLNPPPVLIRELDEPEDTRPSFEK